MTANVAANWTQNPRRVLQEVDHRVLVVAEVHGRVIDERAVWKKSRSAAAWS